MPVDPQPSAAVAARPEQVVVGDFTEEAVQLFKSSQSKILEHELAEEDKARASRAEIWVQGLEEVPPEVLQDAIEQQRDYLRRVRERAAELAGQKGEQGQLGQHSSDSMTRRVNGASLEHRVSQTSSQPNKVLAPPPAQIEVAAEAPKGPVIARQPSREMTEFRNMSMRTGNSQDSFQQGERANRIASLDGAMAGSGTMSPKYTSSQDLQQKSDSDAHNRSHGGSRYDLQRHGSSRSGGLMPQRGTSPQDEGLSESQRAKSDQLREALQRYNAVESFVQVLSCVGETTNLEKEFDNFDLDNDRLISMAEFLFTCAAMGTGLRKDKVEAVFKAIDTDGNGSIDIGEFLSAFLVARQYHWGFHDASALLTPGKGNKRPSAVALITEEAPTSPVNKWGSDMHDSASGKFVQDLITPHEGNPNANALPAAGVHSWKLTDRRISLGGQPREE